MVVNLLARGAEIDYVNEFGLTALHICVEKKLAKQVEYLLFKNANPHIMDLKELDVCDKAKKNGMAIELPQLNNCNIRKKIIPCLPNGTYPNFEFRDVYQKQKIKMTGYQRKQAKPTQSLSTTGMLINKYQKQSLQLMDKTKVVKFQDIVKKIKESNISDLL